MKLITPGNVAAIRPGSRVWVKEWDEVFTHLHARDGILSVAGPISKLYLDPSKVTLYLLATEEPATVAPGIFYHVAEVNWI